MATDQERREAAVRLKRYHLNGEEFSSVWRRGCDFNDDIVAIIGPYLPSPADDAPCTDDNLIAAGMMVDGTYTKSPGFAVYRELPGLRSGGPTSLWRVSVSVKGTETVIPIHDPANIGELRILCRLFGDPLPTGDES